MPWIASCGRATRNGRSATDRAIATSTQDVEGEHAEACRHGDPQPAGERADLDKEHLTADRDPVARWS
jgi:hypothetical protein